MQKEFGLTVITHLCTQSLEAVVPPFLNDTQNGLTAISHLLEPRFLETRLKNETAQSTYFTGFQY